MLKCVMVLALCTACAGGSSVTGSQLNQSTSGNTTGVSGGVPAPPTVAPPSDPNQRAFTVVNNCAQTVWVSVQSNSGLPLPTPNGFELDVGKSLTFDTNYNWGGRIWGRTNCNFSGATPMCDTGTCGPLECNGAGGTPPASWAEFTLDGDGGKDYYDVSLVDGYNLPVEIAPSPGMFTPDSSQGSMWCGTPTCTGDLLATCPPELQQLNDQNQVVACKSACLEFGTSQYCCSGAQNTSATCPPTDYSKIFKAACPSEYSYAYDDPTSLYGCKSQGYTVTFCPHGGGAAANPNTVNATTP